MNLFIGRTNADDLSNKFGGRWITTCFKGVGGPIKSCGFVHFGVEQVYQNQTFNSEHHVPCDELIASVMSEVSKNFRKFFPNNNDSDARYVDELMKSILAMNYRKVFFTAVIKYTKDLKTAAFDIGEPSTSTVRAQANKWETELSESEEEEGLEDESDEYDSDNDHGYVYLDFDGIKVKSYYDLDKEALAEKKQELRQAQAYEKSTGIDMKEARWSFCIAEIKLLNLLNVDGFFLKGSGIDKFVHIDKAIGKLTVINNRQCLTVVPLKYIDATFPELKEFEIEFGRLHGDFSTLKPLFFRNLEKLTIRNFLGMTAWLQFLLMSLSGEKLKVLEIVGPYSDFDRNLLDIISKFKQLKTFTVNGKNTHVMPHQTKKHGKRSK